MIKYKYAMKKLIYLSTLLFLFVLPMMAQQPLFPTPAKVQNRKGSFVIGKNLQVQGNGGYADKLAAALPAEFPRLFLCYEICGEMSEKVDVQSNFITGTVFAAFFHRR